MMALLSVSDEKSKESQRQILVGSLSENRVAVKCL